MTEAAPEMARKVGPAAIWILIVLEAAAMGLAGISKFTATEMWTGLFTEWGYPIWFALVVGAAEAAGAGLLLFPKLASYAAGFLIMVMLGALGTLVLNSSDLGLKAPALHLIVLAIILQARWARRLR